MLFGVSSTRPTSWTEPHDCAESGSATGQNAIGRTMQTKGIVGSSARQDVLAGWRTCGSDPNERRPLRCRDFIEITDVTAAIQQNILLRKKLREARQEVDILIEALEYARRISAA
ncbi:hypothetical protein [Paraburkholderia dilworthii]|uniref:hypothetical protein n=1 Tax=Paraburkholderia dilworthii TaxID=948106 RepID=UPI000483D8A4|nr:hypothetical protein [Paraburkholderia dilworthii]